MTETTNAQAADASEREELIAYIFDETKAVEGRKARGVNWDAYSTEELRAWAERLSEQIQEVIEQERRDMIARNVQRWQEQQATLNARQRAMNYKPLTERLQIPV